MSQVGYTPILIYASGTATNTPLAANLTSGASGAELALNYADGKLFYKDSGGTVQVLATKGSAVVGGSNTQVQYNSSGALAGSANMTFDGTKLTVAGLKDSALTSGRVTYATTSGELTDSANLTFNGTNLGLGISSTNDTFVIYNATTPGMRFYNSTTGTLSSDGSQIYVSGNDFLFINRESAAVYTGTANTIRTTLDASGNFGIGTMSPSATLDVSGTAKVSGAVTLSGGTANGVAYLDGSKVLTTGSALTFDGVSAVNLSNSNGGYFRYTNTANTSGFDIGLLGGSTENTGYIYNRSSGGIAFAANNVEGMRLTSTGLGIGTSSPGQKLHVVGDGNFARATATDTYVQVSNSVATFNITQSANGSTYLYNYGAYNLYFGTGAATKMTLDSSGNLGIGTSSPSQKLTVAGGIASTTGISALAASTAFFDFNSGNARFAAVSGTTGTAAPILFSQYSSNGSVGRDAMTLDSSGNLGLGVTPSAWGSGHRALDIGSNSYVSGSTSMTVENNVYFNGTNNIYKNTAAATQYQQTNAGTHTWSVAGSGTAGATVTFTQAMTLDANGNLVIGNTTASQRFQVEQNQNASTWGYFVNTNSGSGAAAGVLFKNNTGDLGAISVLSSANSPADALFVRSLSTNPLVFGTNNTERARIDSSGNLLVGSTSSLGYRSQIFSSTNGYTQALVQTAGYSSGYLSGTVFSGYYDGSNITDMASIRGGKENTTSGNYGGMLAFYTRSNGGSDTERARIDSSGYLLVGTTTNSYNGRITSEQSSTYTWAYVSSAANSGGSYFHIEFRPAGGAAVGNITSTASATSYNTSSDYRLKDNIAPMTGALAKVSALKPVTYKWKLDGSDGEGFIAHELAEVCPNAVTGEKDAVDSEGKPKYQGIDTSFLVATLTAAIQELKAEFDAYKATHP